MAVEKNPYSMNLVKANSLKIYNQGQVWAFNLAKYRAFLTNDPVLIKQFYKKEAALLAPDVHEIADLKRSFYYGDDFVENAEEYFGLIPMVCESIAKLVAGSGYVFEEGTDAAIKGRLINILDDNRFNEEILDDSIIESVGLGDCAWHVHFDPEVSSLPIIEYVPPERLIIEKKHNRIVKVIVKQQVVIDNEPQPYELHTVYTKNRVKYNVNGAERWRDDGIVQEFKVWNGTKYYKSGETLKAVFEAYGLSGGKTILPLTEFPVIYLPIKNHKSHGGGDKYSRPTGLVFGLDTVSSAIDETLSNCVDTIRKCFPFLLIDEQMIPSDIYGDKDKAAFSTRRHNFMLPSNAKEPEKLLQMIQAKLNTSEYVDSVKFQINIALNKVGLNAATLGLQLTGHVEAEATQNAKERNSIRTRNRVSAKFESYLSQLFTVLLQYEDYINGSTIAKDNATGEQGIVVNEYKGIKAKFNDYIVDTPEEVSQVIARKVQANIMSIFAAVREQHPDWGDDAIYKEANLIYAEKMNQPMQVVDTQKPTEESVVLLNNPQSGENGAGNGAQGEDGSGVEEDTAQKQKGGQAQNNEFKPDEKGHK